MRHFFTAMLGCEKKAQRDPPPAGGELAQPVPSPLEDGFSRKGGNSGAPPFKTTPMGCTHRLRERAAYGGGLPAGSGSRCAFFVQPRARLRKNDRRKAALKFVSSSVSKMSDDFTWLLKKEILNRTNSNEHCLREAFFHRHAWL